MALRKGYRTGVGAQRKEVRVLMVLPALWMVLGVALLGPHSKAEQN